MTSFEVIKTLIPFITETEKTILISIIKQDIDNDSINVVNSTVVEENLNSVVSKDEDDLLDKFNNLSINIDMPKDEENLLSSSNWKNISSFKSISDKETQIKYYKKMNACDEVLQLVELESKPFGSESEKIIRELFNLGPRTSTQNDATFNGKKIEIKSARYWAGKDDCRWQHLEPEHDYEYVLFVLLDFNGWKVWSIKKSLLMGELREKNIVTYQGKQGWWVCKSAIEEYLTPIKSVKDLKKSII
jgi:hypothetical protein